MLTEIVPQQRIKAYDVAVAFVEEWALKYVPPIIFVCYNRLLFMSLFFQNVCKMLSVNNLFTGTYHSKTQESGAI